MAYRDRKRPVKNHSLRRWTIGIMSVGIVVWSGIWCVQWLRASQQITQVKQLQQQLAESEKLPEAQRRELWTQMRDAMEQLPEESRRDLWQEQRQQFEQRMDDRMRKVLLLPPEQRAAEIDKQINEMEQRRKEWEQRRQQRQASGRGGPGGNPQGQSAGGPNAGGRGDRQRGEGRRRAPDPTGKLSLERTKRRLDRSTPEQRAMREEYRRLVDSRRQQRGLPTNPWPR